jgi:predicted nucleic acid-binding Zn ribbon protein
MTEVESYHKNSLAAVLKKVLKNKGWEKKVREHRVFEVWEDEVGGPIAENTRPKSVSRGVLFVIAKSSVWVQELTLKKPEIMKRLNSRLGEALIKDIKFAQGEITAKENKENPSKSQSRIEVDRKIVDNYTKDIGDEDLKKTIGDVLSKALSHEDEA